MIQKVIMKKLGMKVMDQLVLPIIVEALTNNKNRTAAEIRSTFSKFGGNLRRILAASGLALATGFGTISLDKDLVQEDELLDFLIGNDTDDYEVGDNEYSIFCDQKQSSLFKRGKLVKNMVKRIFRDLI